MSFKMIVTGLTVRVRNGDDNGDDVNGDDNNNIV